MPTQATNDDFSLLAAEAAAAGAGGAPGAAGEPGADQGAAGVPGAAVESANVKEFYFAFTMIKKFPGLRSKFPTMHAMMADEDMKASAEAMGALFDKYHWSLSDLFAKYMIEFNAAMVFGGWTYAMAGALITDLDNMKAAKAASDQAKPSEKKKDDDGGK